MQKALERYKRYLILFLFLCISCGREHKVISMTTFQETSLGLSEKDLRRRFGMPVQVFYLENGLVAYQYIERIHGGPGYGSSVEGRRYYFTLKDGKVVSKQLVLKNKPPAAPFTKFSQL